MNAVTGTLFLIQWVLVQINVDIYRLVIRSIQPVTTINWSTEFMINISAVTSSILKRTSEDEIDVCMYKCLWSSEK